MKKIRTITFHNAHNYGAMLQAYALIKKLDELGYDAEIIDYRNPIIENRYKVIKVYGKNPIKIIRQMAIQISEYSINKKRYMAFSKFMKEKLKCSKNTYYDVKDIKEDADVYITGSDQVWNPNIVGEISDAYTLNFGNREIKRISYAASIGNSNIEPKYVNEYKNKLEKIDFISVREEDAKESLKKIIDKDITIVLDPTLLLTKEEWNKEIKECPKEKEKYILAYVVEDNEEYRKIVNYLSEKTGLKVIHFEKKDNYKNVLKNAYTEGPMEFVNLIKNAEYVVATSFHATVFSILYNKKFFIIPHKKTGSRVTNLLDKLNIKDRIYYNLDEFKNIDYNLETNWNNVERILEEERKKSIKFLLNSIGENK